MQTHEERQQFYRFERFVMNTDTFMNGSPVRNHISSKTVFETMQHRKLHSGRGSWLVNEFLLQPSLFNNHDTFKEENESSSIFLKLVYLTNDILKCVKSQSYSSTGRLVG